MENHQATTLSGLLRTAAGEFPSLRALSVSGKFDLTHSALQHLVDHSASQLISYGVRPGDVIALTFPNTAEFVIMFLAVIRARATAAPLNPFYTADEFEFYLSDSESKLLLTSQEGNPLAQSAASKLNIPLITASLPNPETHIILTPSKPPEFQSSVDSVDRVINQPSDIALFLHTSGTTSRPKGVPLTQLNLASSVQNIKSVYKLTESDSTVIVLPLFHLHGLVAGLLSSLSAGAAVTLPSEGRFSVSSFWPDMLKSNATWYTAVPTIHQILLDRHVSKPEPAYPKLRFIRSCSASLVPVVMERLEAVFGAPVLEAYALTEATHMVSSNPLPENGPRKAGSVGRPVGQEMAILDEDGGVVQGAWVSGEVCVRGPNVTKGYKNDLDAVAFRYGWFHTGDVGFWDSDGYLHLVGRMSHGKTQHLLSSASSTTSNMANKDNYPDENESSYDSYMEQLNRSPFANVAYNEADAMESHLERLNQLGSFPAHSRQGGSNATRSSTPRPGNSASGPPYSNNGSQEFFNRGGGRRSGNNSSPPTCQICGIYGHTAAICDYRTPHFSYICDAYQMNLPNASHISINFY